MQNMVLCHYVVVNERATVQFITLACNTCVATLFFTDIIYYDRLKFSYIYTPPPKKNKILGRHCRTVSIVKTAGVTVEPVR